MKSDIIAIIPARSGSKSLPDKNIRILNNKPLIAHSIECALQSEYIDRVIVSTDSEYYADIARQYGAEAPFLRPANISGDTSLDIEVFEHTLNWLSTNENIHPSILVHLRPTHPIRKPKDIDIMIETIRANPQADSIRSLSLAKETPYKMWFFDNSNANIIPVINDNLSEAYNMPRQLLPVAYLQNACVDIVRSKTIIENKSMTGNIILGYPMPFNFDIDTEEDFLAAEQYMQLSALIKEKRKLTMCCDIDGVIAGKTEDNDYSKAFPIISNINIINLFFESGHNVILFTARGYVTGIDWKDITSHQMLEWGVKYTELCFGKPAADIYIDDRFITLSALKNIIERS